MAKESYAKQTIDFLEKEREFNSILKTVAEMQKMPDRVKIFKAKNATIDDVITFIQNNFEK